MKFRALCWKRPHISADSQLSHEQGWCLDSALGHSSGKISKLEMAKLTPVARVDVAFCFMEQNRLLIGINLLVEGCGQELGSSLEALHTFISRWEC